MATNDRRVVLLKPGDVLLIGNCGHHASPEQLANLGAMFREELGILPVFFRDDIDIDKLPSEIRGLGKVEA